MSVVVLCAASGSVYERFECVETFDARKDARSYLGASPVICHPPCRIWSATCRQLAKPDPGERELGLWCCDTLRRCGGILEQPAFSRLFEAGGLPMPGETIGNVSTIEVWQCWWSFPAQKKTWLALAGIDLSQVEIPLQLTNRGSKAMDRMSRRQRSETIEPFARWLIELASKAKIG